MKRNSVIGRAAALLLAWPGLLLAAGGGGGGGGGNAPLPAITAPPAQLPAVNAPVVPPADLAGWACNGNCGVSAADGDIPLAPFTGHSGQYGYVSSFSDLSEPSNYGLSPLLLSGDAPTNGSRIVSPLFHATAGSTIDVWFDYLTSDGKQFPDYAWSRLINSGSGESTYLFAARATKQGAARVIPGGVLPTTQFDPDVTIVGYRDWSFQLTDAPSWAPLGPDGLAGNCFAAGTCGHTGWVDARVAFAATGDYRLEIGVVNVADSIQDSGLAFDFGGLLLSPVPEPRSSTLLLAGMGACLAIALRRRRGDAG